MVEVWSNTGVQAARLDGDKVSVGKGDANDIVISGDPAVSRVHLLFELVGSEWTVRDLGSRNGTFLNGERLSTTRLLHTADELRLGATRLVYRVTGASSEATATTATDAPPVLTRRERDCLAALCAPVLRGSVITEPASVLEVANAMFVTDSAVKKLLARLYDKFGLYDADRRRGKLASEALRRGAIQFGDADA